MSCLSMKCTWLSYSSGKFQLTNTWILNLYANLWAISQLRSLTSWIKVLETGMPLNRVSIAVASDPIVEGAPEAPSQIKQLWSMIKAFPIILMSSTTLNWNSSVTIAHFSPVILDAAIPSLIWSMLNYQRWCCADSLSLTFRWVNIVISTVSKFCTQIKFRHSLWVMLCSLKKMSADINGRGSSDMLYRLISRKLKALYWTTRRWFHERVWDPIWSKVWLKSWAVYDQHPIMTYKHLNCHYRYHSISIFDESSINGSVRMTSDIKYYWR